MIDVLQSFVDEMVDIAKADWLKEYYTTGDKKGLIAKVGTAHAQQRKSSMASVKPNVAF